MSHKKATDVLIKVACLLACAVSRLISMHRYTHNDTVIYCNILWYTVVYGDILQYTVMYCDILWCTVIYCGILWYTVVYCDILWYTVVCVEYWPGQVAGMLAADNPTLHTKRAPHDTCFLHKVPKVLTVYLNIHAWAWEWETRPHIPSMCLTNRGRKTSSVLNDFRPDEGK